MNTEKNHLDNNIAEYRKKAGYFQRDFAEKIGITQQNLSLIENNKNFPKSYEIDLMLKTIGNITFDELFSTGRLSIYISKPNQEALVEYINKLGDVFSTDLTDYQKQSIVINHILRMFFEGRLGGTDLSKSIKEEVNK
jgi:DNA-binding XRE family transcriptional regulator